MAKAQPCTLICNTKIGYELTPRKFCSIRKAVAYAHEMGLAYRVFVNGKVVRSGWKLT